MPTTSMGRPHESDGSRHGAATFVLRRVLTRSFWKPAGSHVATGRQRQNLVSLVLYPAAPGRHARRVYTTPDLRASAAWLRHRIGSWFDHPLIGTRRAELVAAGAVVGWTLLIYFATNAGLASRLTAISGVDPNHPLAWQAISAALWGTVAAGALYVWRHRLTYRPRANRTMLVLAFLTAMFQIALLLLAGLALGFGRSPYSHDALPMVGNVLYFLSVVVALEMGRACVVAALRRWNDTLAVGLATVLFGFLALPLARLTMGGAAESLLATTGEHVLPTLSRGLLASLLALVGGPLGAIVYQATLEAFEWLSPILPDVRWPVLAFIGTLAPLTGLWIFKQTNQAVPATPDHAIAKTDLGWLSVGVISVSMLWLVTGMFGVQPFIVSGPSMQPTLSAGDMVIIRDVDPTTIEIGDVIRFRNGDITVIHRVVERDDSGGRPVFITRGDNNNRDDPPVLAAQVDGEVVATLPKLGWPSIWIRQLVGGRS